jgi:hypothetical protein
VVASNDEQGILDQDAARSRGRARGRQDPRPGRRRSEEAARSKGGVEGTQGPACAPSRRSPPGSLAGIRIMTSPPDRRIPRRYTAPTSTGCASLLGMRARKGDDCGGTAIRFRAQALDRTAAARAARLCAPKYAPFCLSGSGTVYLMPPCPSGAGRDTAIGREQVLREATRGERSSERPALFERRIPPFCAPRPL